MIVKNEAENLPHVLASIAGVVDEVVVYDTGSTDDTVALARAAGCRVEEGYWDNDFARARNAALAMTQAEWILVVDGDDRLVGNGAALRAYLSGSTGAFPGAPPARSLDFIQMRVLNVSATDEERHSLLSLRIARRDGVRWNGRVHEMMQIGDNEPCVGRTLLLTPQVMHIRHSGYNDTTVRRAKGVRNLELAQAQVDDLATRAEQDPRVASRAILDLGRSLLMLGHRQEAVEAFETVREIAAGGVLQAHAIALLTQTLLDHGGHDQAALVLVDELRAGGFATNQYCDWLAAQGLARIGRRAEALDLLRGIEEVMEPVGNQLTLEPVLLARVIFAGAEGQMEEAAEVLADCLVQFGVHYDHATLLLRLWRGREVELADRLTGANGAFLDDVLGALRQLGEAGEKVASLVGTRTDAPVVVPPAATGGRSAHSVSIPLRPAGPDDGH
ncbi:MAG: glycosyltransferase [Kineosporiaceae bacterium]|nr:glycosyltransferase [Kineosporiaceae bacterium]